MFLKMYTRRDTSIKVTMSWVTEQIFAAGGEMIPQDWARFQHETGICAVLHLNPCEPTPFVGPVPERFLWLDIAEEEQSGLAVRTQAAQFVFDAVQAGCRVLLHATQGMHRTRWVFVAFLILSGRRPAAAVRLAEELPWLAPYETDPDGWDAFYRSLHAARRGGTDAV